MATGALGVEMCTIAIGRVNDVTIVTTGMSVIRSRAKLGQQNLQITLPKGSIYNYTRLGGQRFARRIEVYATLFTCVITQLYKRTREQFTIHTIKPNTILKAKEEMFFTFTT